MDELQLGCVPARQEVPLYFFERALALVLPRHELQEVVTLDQSFPTEKLTSDRGQLALQFREKGDLMRFRGDLVPGALGFLLEAGVQSF